MRRAATSIAYSRALLDREDLQVATLVYGMIVEIFLVSAHGAGTAVLWYWVTFRPIAALSFSTTSTPWCTPISPRTFLLPPLSPAS